MKLRKDLLQLNSNEKIIFFLHHHPFVFVKKIVTFILFALIPFLIFLVLKKYFIFILENQVIYPLLILLASSWLVFVWVTLFQSWLSYYFDLWVVTDKQIINIEQSGLFNRSLAKQPLSRVQDVTIESKGFFPTILRYGNVYVQTAGLKERFVFKEVKGPYEVAKKINDLVENILKNP